MAAHPQRIAALAVVSALLFSCAAQEDPRTEAARSYVREVTGADLPKPTGLQISTTDVTTDGRIAKVRGMVKNNFSETVHGVRYVVTIYQQGSPPRVLDRWQQQVDTAIEPGQRVAMRLDVDSMYFGSRGPVPFNIDAQPVAVGDQAVPPPEGWQ
jgi:hypothetical protein